VTGGVGNFRFTQAVATFPPCDDTTGNDLAVPKLIPDGETINNADGGAIGPRVHVDTAALLTAPNDRFD
jgi:hypothetical protein